MGWMGLALAQEALGPMYPIAEPDLLQILKQHAKEESQEVNRRSRETRENLKRYAQEPIGGANLPTARVDREWSYSTQATNNQVIPNDFERQWLFINANDKEQVQLAHRFMQKKTVATHRVILVQGNVKTTRDSLKERVWFDQAGILVKKFEIQAVPCLMKATKTAIHLKEIAL